MSVALLFLTLSSKVWTNEALISNAKNKNIKIHYEENLNAPDDNNNNLPACVAKILNEYYHEEKVLTYVDMNFGCNNIIKLIYSSTNLSVVSRKSNVKLRLPNEGYLITVRSVSNFSNLLYNLTKEATWNPKKKFIIVFELICENELKFVFDSLLKTHVHEVLIINGTNDADLYTYNAFQNYACGKYYSRIIPYGKCLITKANLFPEKLLTGLRNCTFHVAAPHWPPYSIHPSKRSDGMLEVGVEQYIMKIIAEKEHFKLNYTFTDDAEEFSTVSLNMSATGPMTMLQNNITDAMLGGLLLIPSRAEAFQYLYGHLDYADEMRFMVKKASLIPAWKNFYLEFDSTVWVLLLFILITFSILIIILMRAKDKSSVVLKLLDNLILHGYNLQSRMSVKCVLILWVWFAYLVNCFYQSILMSLTTKPGTIKQISHPADLIQFGIKPCLSYVIKSVIKAETGSDSYLNQMIEEQPGCESFLKSIDTVSKSSDLYTIVIYSIYNYNKYLFYDKWHNPLLYSFQTPVLKIVNAIYMYKGFPMQSRMHLLTIRMKENGLVQKHLEYQYFLKELKHRYKSRGFEARFVAPWYLYTFGCTAAFVAFALEYLSKLKTNLSRTKYSC